MQLLPPYIARIGSSLSFGGGGNGPEGRESAGAFRHMSLLRPPAFFHVGVGVHGLRTGLANVFFINTAQGGSDWVLVDAGVGGYTGPLLRAAESLFGGRPPLAIILTHGHFDHVGTLARLLRKWRTPLFAHAAELKFINAQQAYPPPDPTVGGGLLARFSPLYPRRVGALPQDAAALPEDGTVPFLPGWQWIHTPGHAPGHVSLYQDSGGVLIAGDALITTRQESAWAVLRQVRELRPPPAYFTTNWQESYDSIRRLQALDPASLASGHGLVVGGDRLKRSLALLVRNFAEIGVPRQGRYVAATWPTETRTPPMDGLPGGTA